jgi:hypothetical protein
MLIHQLWIAPEPRCANVRPYVETSVTLIARTTVEAPTVAFVNADHSAQPSWTAKVGTGTKENHEVTSDFRCRHLKRANVLTQVIVSQKHRPSDVRELLNGSSVGWPTVAYNNHLMVAQWWV